MDITGDIVDISLDSSSMGGVELLMNNSSKKDGGAHVDADDIHQLEHELNNLSSSSSHHISHSSPEDIRIGGSEPAIGKHTTGMGSVSGNSTWDGFGRSAVDSVVGNADAQPLAEKLSHDDELKEKFKYLRKLESLEKSGFMPTKHYSMDSDLVEMRMEYETAIDERHRSNSVKFQANLMMTMVNGIEFLNSQFDPFDVKLDGWGEQVHENVREYDDVFGELYDKYKSRGSIAPELKLLFQLGGSAVMVHMTNSMFKSAPPDVGDIFRSNPELMRQFQSAAVNSIAATNPGVAGFMNSVGGVARSPPTILSTSPPTMAGAGAPMARPQAHQMQQHQQQQHQQQQHQQQQQQHQQQQQQQHQQQQRQVHIEAMGGGGLSMEHQDRGGNNPPPRSVRPDLVAARANEAPPRSERRPEMRGPSDIDGILSGLKSKSLAPPTAPAASNISAEDIGSIGQSATAKPKRRRRPTGSEKNIVSIDI